MRLDRIIMQNSIQNHHVTLMIVHHVNQLIITVTINRRPLDHRILMRIDHKARIRELNLFIIFLIFAEKVLVQMEFPEIHFIGT